MQGEYIQGVEVRSGLGRERSILFLMMAQDQLEAWLLQLKDDAELQEKLKGAADLDAAVTVAKAAGFDVSKADWLSNKRLIGAHLLWEWNWI